MNYLSETVVGRGLFTEAFRCLVKLQDYDRLFRKKWIGYLIRHRCYQ